ncbi:DUF1176 domain-containing protein [Notoacmeibacter ruber]|uniref:DUF1176 domain-containing protein n=1 Tax=Notoacmeibacter ruber TaxID=2670375 RepID=A0A3L7JA59_9HYPH|nr:DUF1176 domain-containing protein [Notoacmeibacter ruber]RLQ87506.1 DUF1176 domain-containing protein [Notoacmeibacter ruber]
MSSRYVRLLFLPLLALAEPSMAQSSDISGLPYYDDRSLPQTVIFSLYNAINRREFSRAYSYFGIPPAASPEDYAAGFEEMAMVQIATGGARQEGAAGSIYAVIPVAIRSVGKDGSQDVYAGCMRLRLAQPSIQASDFTGWHIDRTAIAASDQAYETAMMDCDDSGSPVRPEYGPEPMPQTPPEGLAQTIALTQSFLRRDSDECDDALGVHPESVTILPQSSDPDDNGPVTVLASFTCAMGAYNMMTKWLSSSEASYTISHSFAEAEVDYDLGPSPEQGVDGPVERIDVTGWTTTDQLINASWNAQAEAITTYAKWRGFGDALSTATYKWNGRGFTLSEFAVDPSFDGEQETITVFPPDAAARSAQ